MKAELYLAKIVTERSNMVHFKPNSGRLRQKKHSLSKI